MFESLKKKGKNTLRSLLATATLLTAGVQGTQAAETEKPTAKSVQTASRDSLMNRISLMKGYQVLCAALEKDLCYCYSDDGVPAVGSGVHFKDFPELENVEGIKITFKPGTVVRLKDRESLQKLADAVWKDMRAVSRFPSVLKSKKIKLKDVTGGLPKGHSHKLEGSNLILVPSGTLSVVNTTALHKNVQNALTIHPNLFQLPPLARCVVVDLIYSLGRGRYQSEFIEFKKAVEAGDLTMMRKHCTTVNDRRRSAIKMALLDAAILMRDNPKLSQETCVNLFHHFVSAAHVELLKKDLKLLPDMHVDSPLVPKREKELFDGLDKTVRTAWRDVHGLLNDNVAMPVKQVKEK